KASAYAHLPELKINNVQDYLDPLANGRISIYHQTKHFAYPLNSDDQLAYQDKLAFLTGALTKPKHNELIAVQFVIKPFQSRKVKKLRQLVKRNEDIESFLNHPSSKAATIINRLLFALTDTVTFAYHGNRNAYSQPQKENFQKQQAALRLRPARILSPFEQEQYEAINRKLNQPLFRCSLRVMVQGLDVRQSKDRLDAIESAVSAFSDFGYQHLRLRSPFLRQF